MQPGAIADKVPEKGYKREKMSIVRFKEKGEVEPLGDELQTVKQTQGVKGMDGLREAFFSGVDREVLREKITEMCHDSPREVFEIAAMITPKELKASGQLSIAHLLGELGPPSEREKMLLDKENYRLSHEEEVVEVEFEEGSSEIQSTPKSSESTSKTPKTLESTLESTSKTLEVPKSERSEDEDA